MFGAIYGDVIGSYYEVHSTKDIHFPFQKDATFTDDSVLTAAVCKAILDHPAPIGRFGVRRRAKEYGSLYRQYYGYFPNAGFGNMFARWAKDAHAANGHSYANGAAMRVVPIGYAYDTLEQTLLPVKASCLPTHKHALRAALQKHFTEIFPIISVGFVTEKSTAPFAELCESFAVFTIHNM